MIPGLGVYATVGHSRDEHTGIPISRDKTPKVGLDVAVGSALSNQDEDFDNFLSATVNSEVHALSDRGRPIYY